jgi:hypothetical protein
MRIMIALVLASFGPKAFVQGPAPLPRFAGGAIPDPPNRREPWTPPETKLPRFLVEATLTLAEQGLADPRGCDYREIGLELDRDRPAFQGAPLPALHGWVLPSKLEGGPRFAVGWDGLVHPLASIGPEADLEGDVRAMLLAQSGSVAGKNYRFLSRGFAAVPALRDRMVASQQVLLPMKVVMLLRLGRADLAERAWSAATGWTPDRGKVDLTSYGVSYLTLASDWAWCLFDRALEAHAAGDDPLALVSLRELDLIQSLVEAKAMGMGFPRHQQESGIRIAGVRTEVQFLPYLDFLRPLPALLADQERRAKEPRPEGDPSKIADRDARIAALIRGFDGIRVVAEFIPGRGNPAGSPVVQAVIKEGDAAVGPLLECLEHDDRLTRTVDRDNRHGTRFVGVGTVGEAAYAALVAILGTRELGPNARYFSGSIADRAKRVAVAAEIRSYWQKTRGLSSEEKWYRTLADDNASPDQWLDAAEALSQPADVRGRGGSYTIPYRVGGKVPSAKGESLRGRKDPSVTDLMARRVEAIDPSGAAVGANLANPRGGSGAIYVVLKANRLARFLAQWDLEGSLPTLRARVGRCRAIIDATRGEGSDKQGLEVDLAAFTLDRLRGGDPRALDEYADWVRTLLTGRLDSNSIEMFEPMWRNPDQPAIAAAAVAMFDDPKSPWVPLFRSRERGWGEMGSRSDVIVSPLLGLAPFRKLVLAGLADKSPTGTISTDAEGKIVIGVDEGWSSMPDPPKDDPLRPKPSTRMTLRLADLYCWKLQGLDATPRLEMYWPEAKRDEAIAICIAFLSRYGERFRYIESARPLYEAAPFYPRHPRAVLAFPALDRPATEDDVRAGRAVFHLGGTEVRRFPLPANPIKARWTTLQIPPDDPLLLMNKGSQSAFEMLQGGTVWQAEEANEGGAWRRYYGFVGRDTMARVPAEEIEFPSPWNTGWSRVSVALDGRVVPPGGRDDGTRIVMNEVSPDGPLPVEVWFRNRRGVEVTSPVDYARGEGGLSLRDGVSIRLFREPDASSAQARSQGVAAPWDEIPAKAIRRHQPDRISRAIGPAEATRAIRLDLRDVFDLSRPGRYRVEIAFDDQADPGGKPGRLAGYFTVAGTSKADR